MKTWLNRIVFGSLLLVLISCNPASNSSESEYQLDLDDNTRGTIQIIDHIYNTIVVSNDPNIYKAEYEAGFIQGALQGEMILSARDNTWDNAYLTNPSHTYPKQIPPSANELTLAQKTLQMNWDYTLDYIQGQGSSDVGLKMRRLMYRMLGIYHGATRPEPEALPFDEQWLPAFQKDELQVGYETETLSFMDLYFVNSFGNIFDILPDNAPQVSFKLPSKCSAFVKKTADDIYITHNSWTGYLGQSQALTLWVNGDFLTMNIVVPGLISSGADFGYNNHGILFNETTHHATYSEPKTKALWMFWRAALAEQFSSSLDEFFYYISL